MEEERDLREALATGEKLDDIIIRASVDENLRKRVIELLDDDLWTVQKNALKVILSLEDLSEEFYDQLISKLMVMIRRSEAVPLTQEIAKGFGILSKKFPEKIRRVIPVIFANYRIGDPKIKINMAYVLEEIMRQNPTLLTNVFRDISFMLSSREATDKLTALNFVAALAENGTRYVTPFLPKLFLLLDDRDELVRASTVEVLLGIAGSNEKLKGIIISKLEEYSNDPSPLVRKKIEEGLLRLRFLKR